MKRRPPIPRDVWLVLREEALKRDHYRCRKCLRERPDVQLQVHHIIERRKGGADTVDNLRTECVECHQVEHPWLLKHGYNSAKKLDRVVERVELKRAIKRGCQVMASARSL